MQNISGPSANIIITLTEHVFFFSPRPVRSLSQHTVHTIIMSLPSDGYFFLGFSEFLPHPFTFICSSEDILLSTAIVNSFCRQTAKDTTFTVCRQPTRRHDVPEVHSRSSLSRRCGSYAPCTVYLKYTNFFRSQYPSACTRKASGDCA